MPYHLARREPADRWLCVLHLVINLDVGGLERVVLNHVRFADQSPYEPGVLCLEAQGQLASDVRALGVPKQAMGSMAFRSFRR